MNSEMNNFAGNILQNNFTPTVTTCYHVHADAHLSVALICCLDATGAETSMLLNCILQGWAIIVAAQGPL